MQVLVSLGTAAVSVAAVGVLALFDRDSGDDLSDVARRVDAARDDPEAIERRLDDLEYAIDRLVADTDLDRHVRDAPEADASSVEKAEALSQAVERDQLSVRPASGSGGDGAVASAAARVQREESPSSPAARRLLDAAASPERADPGDVEELLERAISALDARQTLERALDGVDDDLDSSAARRISGRLDRPNDDVTRTVGRLAEAAAEGRSTAERRESERERIADATDALTAAAADEADVDVGPDSDRPVAERLRVLADAVDRGDLGFAGGDGGRVAELAGEVRRSRKPESAVAKRLLDRLASPGMGDVRAALDTAVEQLDAASTTQSVAADLDRESIRDLADDVAARLDDEGPTADALTERVADLRGMLDRADESNLVIPYAVRNELRFYDRTLLSQLGDGGAATAGGRTGAEASGDAAGGDPEASLAAVAERRERLEDRYVDGRRDHNHSIPLHFLSLVDALSDDAKRAASTGDDRRATGLLAAADETLNYVEQLYERNEYSVMLRRLRG